VVALSQLPDSPAFRDTLSRQRCSAPPCVPPPPAHSAPWACLDPLSLRPLGSRP